jgi:signal transduction histidine kinase
MALFASAMARRTLGFMLAGTVALIVIIATSIWLATKTGDYAEDVTQMRALRRQASIIYVALLDAETSQRGYLLTRDRTYLEPFEKAKPALAAALARMRELAQNDPDESLAVARLTTLSNDKMSELSETIDLAASGRAEAALATVNSDRGKAAMDEVRTFLDGRINRSEARVDDGLADLTNLAQLLSWTTLAGGGLILIFAGGAFAAVARYTRELVTARGQLEILNTDLEQRVAERTSELSRANDEIQRFAYIVSHDLRAPLVNIMGFTSELEVGVAALQRYVSEVEPDEAVTQAATTAADEDIPEAVRFIRTSTTKMDALINAVLKLSREGRRELRPQMVNLREVLTNAAASVQHQIDQAEGQIDIAPKLPMIVSDRLALEQVFGNLIDNAVKYLSPNRPGRIAIEAEERRGRVLISVSDNGRGIAEQDYQRIFELFRRAGEQNQPGEGVGLAHVRALVRRLGGDITVQSRLGEGSTFRVDLPKAGTAMIESSN